MKPRKRSFGTLRQIIGGSLLTLAMLCAPTVALATVAAQKSDTAANGKVIANTGGQCNYGVIHKEALDPGGTFAITNNAANTNLAANNGPTSAITGTINSSTTQAFTAATVNTANGPNIATNAGINRTFVHRATTNGPNVTDGELTNGAFATINIDTGQHVTVTSTG